MSDPVIRPARRADAERLHAALGALARHLGVGDRFRARAHDYARHGLGERGLFHGLIAEANGEVCSAATYFPEFSTMRGCPGIYLQDLWVAEAHRGGGLGRRMLARVVEDASRWEAAYMKLATHVSNPEAIAFYRRLGFATDPDEMTFMIEGAPFAGLRGT